LQTQLAEQSIAQAANASSGVRTPDPTPVSQPHTTQTETRASPPAQTAQRPKTHIVKSGETATSIAAKYGVKLNVFLAANSKINPDRLKPGQTVNIPSSSH
jgi:teichoic acid transport system ATP-binding protein